jgi:RNA polymerase sigma factor (sigma-70 family)
MDSSSHAPTAANLALLKTVVRRAAGAARLTPEDAQDFEQSVHLRLLERQYDIFERFSGRSSLHTFLHTVVRRMLLDWQIQTRGKWRPSAAARRLGLDAVRLERLIARDGLTVAEAANTLRTAGVSDPDLNRISSSLPVRMPRRFVSDTTLTEMAAADFEDPADAAERRRAEVSRRRALAAALRQLSREDRQLLRERFLVGYPMRHIAVKRATNPKVMYRRCDRLLRTLRRTVGEVMERNSGGASVDV